ncbi:MAG: T9SS type A sorting domain-containing protein [Bacteroidales bacterium]|nr:T9SS type A sorting domain-containing protein [Bacteroidales bacterium]
MKRITLLFAVVFLAILHPLTAQMNWTGINNSSPSPAEVRLIESNIDNTKIQFTLDGFFEHQIRTPRGVESIISVDNGVLITEKGMPDLGKLYTSIIIPDLYEMEYKIVDAKYTEFSNIAVSPSKGHFTRNIRPDDVPFTYGEVYNEDAFWPGDLAQLEEPFIMRDFRGQTVTIFPFQYNPVTQTLRVYTDIVVEVFSTGTPGREPLVRTRDQIRVESEFGKIYERFFLNSKTADKNYPLLEGEEGSMLIIAYDDFMDAMQPFVDWKRQTGRKTVMVPKSEAGATPAAIKSYVQNYYNENEDFAYLLLIGDGPQIPPVTTSSGHSDNAYGFLVGSNSYNDIFVGRFSAETVAHVETQVQRMIEYERDLTTADTWLSNGIGIARNEGTGGGHNGGENDYVHMNFVRDTLLNFTYDVVTQRYDGNVPGIPNTTAAEISGDINGGSSIINFINHGSVTGWSVANYSITHVNQLTNIGKLPFIWSVACVNGNFVGNFCFAESWMRATHDGEPTGSIGTMMSTINQLWQPPMTGQDEMVTLLSEQSIFGHETIKRTFGGLSINGSMSMIPAHGSGGLQTHETWILFGDPSLMVRTAAPQEIEASYNPVILIGTTEFEVQVDNAEAASVALSYYDETAEEVVIVGRAYVEDGSATVSFDVEIDQPMNLTLTIMGFNKVTYINEGIEVIPPDGPYVVLDHITVNHASGFLPYDQTTSIDVTVKNVGIEDAENVTATLLIDDAYFTLTSSDPIDLGDVASGDTGNTSTVENAFSFTVANDVPDQYRANAVLQITDGEDVWESTLRLTAAAPVLEFLTMTIEDEGEHNPGVLDPGETADLILEVKNVGNATSQNIEIMATTNSQWIIFLQQTDQLDALEPQGIADAVVTVSAPSTTPLETPATINFEATTGEYDFSASRDIVIGQAPVYDQGDIPTTYNTAPNTGSNAIVPGVLTVTIPENAEITGVDVEYQMTSHNGAWISEQRSFIRVVSEGGTTESTVTSGPSSNSAGTHTYNRTGLEIANDVEGGGDITFELHAFRTWGGSGSNTDYAFVPNNTWKVIVHYELSGLVVTFNVKDDAGNQIPDAVLTFNGQTHSAGSYTVTGLEEGVFEYSIAKSGFTTVSGEVELEDENVQIDVTMNPCWKVTFNINDNFGNEVTDAVIVVGDEAHEAGHYEMNEMVFGTYDYIILSDNHHDYSGSFMVLNGDVNVNVTLTHITTNIDEIAQGISIFPNPATDRFQVSLSGNNQPLTISLSNQHGQVVETRSLGAFAGEQQLNYNMEGFASGVYFLRIETADNVHVYKVILQ